MVPSVPRLDEIRAKDSVLVGGKAAKLGELAAQGFPVPPGFVVPAEACRAFLDALGLRAEILGLEGAPRVALPERCAALQRRIVEADLSAPLAQAIRGAHEYLLAERGPTLLCAVRSSATAEDLESASFAGQHGTYY
jgi:phosphoenolpyruvate synthase/pyruvate phosphate dikinase